MCLVVDFIIAGHDISDLGTSWADGRALAVLINSIQPTLFNIMDIIARPLVAIHACAYAKQLGVLEGLILVVVVIAVIVAT